MNKLSKSLSIAAATVALATPFSSQADSATAAMNSCIDTFVSSNLPKAQRVKVRKENVAATPIGYYSRPYRIEVTAQSAASGKYLARGTCVVDRKGQVVALQGEPLTRKLAAR